MSSTTSASWATLWAANVDHLNPRLARRALATASTSRHAQDAADGAGVSVLPEDVARRKLRSTNVLERFHVEVRRRTRVVGIFPHDASLLRFATALAMDTSEKWSTKRYLPQAVPSTRPLSLPRIA